MKTFAKNLFLVILAGLLLPTGVFAQKAIVKGFLLDSLTHQGEPYATIRVYQQKKMATPVAMNVTNMEGAFQLEVKGKGEHVILFTSVGRTDVIRTFNIKDNSPIDLGTLYISDNVTQLGNVEVVAQKPLVKMTVDKMSYSVSDDVDAKTNTVLDMLRKVPMVTVDGSDNITVNGSSSFKVFVDGKPSVMMSSNPSQIFKNMPASSVQNIEVVTNPGAKYDAEGVGGVLNLIMNKQAATKDGSMDAYNGTIRAMINNKGEMGGAYLSLQKKKLSLSFNGNVAHNNVKNMEISTSREQLNATTGNSMMSYLQNADTKFDVQMGNLSMGYEIDSLRLLSATFGLMGYSTNITGNTQTNLSGGYYGSGFGYGGWSKNKNTHYSINGSVDYQRSFAGNKDKMLTVSYLISTAPDKGKTYNNFNTDEENQYLNLTNRFTNSHKNTIEHTIQLDYATPLGKTQHLDAGLKYILRNNSSKADYYTVKDNDYTWNSASSLDYSHNNDIMAVYVEHSATMGKISTKEGLRYEHTWQDVKYHYGNGENFKMNYGNLVPSANISYRINDRQNIGLAYNMRISRPGITMLNPYIDKSDPTALSYGNTNLETEKAHNINLVYNLFNPKWIVNLTLRESICNNAIDSYSFYNDNLLNTTYGNIVRNHQTGLNAYINWNASKNTRITLNGGVSYVDLNSPTLGLSNNGWQGNMMVGLQQTLPYKIRLSANMIASTKQYNLQGWSTGFNMLVGSLTRTFCKDRLSVSLSAITPVSNSKLELKTFSQGKDYVSHMKTKVPMQSLIFSVSYSFGKQGSSKKAKHTIVNDDVRNVQNQTESIGNVMNQ